MLHRLYINRLFWMSTWWCHNVVGCRMQKSCCMMSICYHEKTWLYYIECCYSDALQSIGIACCLKSSCCVGQKSSSCPDEVSMLTCKSWPPNFEYYLSVATNQHTIDIFSAIHMLCGWSYIVHLGCHSKCWTSVAPCNPLIPSSSLLECYWDVISCNIGYWYWCWPLFDVVWYNTWITLWKKD